MTFWLILKYEKQTNCTESETWTDYKYLSVTILYKMYIMTAYNKNSTRHKSLMGVLLAI